MRCRNIMKDIVNLINYEKYTVALSFILCFCLVGPGALRTAYGQGALETIGTMEISQQIDNGADRATPKKVLGTKKLAPDANAAAEPSRAPDANAATEPSRAPDGMRGRPNPPETTTQPNVQEGSPVATGTETPTAAPAMTADTNVPDVNDFNAFKREINRIDIEARGEDTQWLGKLDKKAELAKAMDDVVVAELRFLLKVAADANDTNTMDAIKLVLKKRQDRLNKLVTKLENELKEERKQQSTERQQRRPAKAGGVQQNQTDRPAKSTNPVQRTKDTVNQEQQ